MNTFNFSEKNNVYILLFYFLRYLLNVNKLPINNSYFIGSKSYNKENKNKFTRQKITLDKFVYTPNSNKSSLNSSISSSYRKLNSHRDYLINPNLDNFIRNDYSNQSKKSDIALKKQKQLLNDKELNIINYSAPIEFDDEIIFNKQKENQQSKISNLLHKKMIISKNIPKLKKLNFNITNQKSTYIQNLMKQKDIIFNKKYLKHLKPVKFYLNSKSKFFEVTRNKSLILPKEYSYEEKSIYEVINGNKFYANKLIIDNNETKNNTNNFFLKRKNSDIITMDNKIIINKLSLSPLKFQYNSEKIKNKKSKKLKFIPYQKMKILSRKGFEKMKEKKFSDFYEELNNAIDTVEKNKKNYKNIMAVNAQIYVNNKNDSLNYLL